MEDEVEVGSPVTDGRRHLLTRNNRTLAVVGSLLMLLSIAIDPLSQQLVSVEPTSVSSEDPLHAAGDNGSQASASSKFRRPGTIPVSHSWGEGSGQQATITILDRNSMLSPPLVLTRAWTLPCWDANSCFS